jgi:multidrug efflux pump subunit AcrB
MGIFQFSIQNRAFVNAIMAGVIFLGIYAFINLPKELSSEISFNWAFIVTDYAGAGPEAVEELITIPLEDEIANVRRVDAISSVSSEGRSVISVKFESMPRDEFRDLFRDLQQEVDGLEKLPEGAEKPAVIDYDSYTWQPLVKVMVMGNLAEEKLKDLTEDLEDRLRAIKHVREVNAYGLRDREIWVEVDPKRLAGYQLTLAEVVTSISRQGMDLPGGRIKGARSEYLIQTAGEFAGPEEIKRVVVRTVDNAGLIRVEDLASVRQTMEEPRALARFNGQPAMGLTVIKDGPGNSIALVKQIKEVVADFLAQAPPSVRVELVGDTSRLIWEALSKLVYNAILGAVLVFILLYFTLGLRNALFAAWGIPMVFMATFLFMKQVGESINGTSLFALVLVSGMIVDDAIVILENIYRYMEKGYDVVPAVLAGGREVVWPVVNSSLTTILSFVPLMFMPGIVGNFLKIIPLVVTLALLASLFEALIILPSHVADWGKLSTRKRRPRLFPWLRRRYLPILKIGLRHRWALMTGVLIVAGAFAGLTPLLGVDMFADEELSQFQIRLSTRPGTRLEETGRAAADMEGLVEKLLSRERKYVGTNIGIQHTDREIKRNTHVGELWVDLTPADQRQRSVDEIIAQLRENTQQLSGFNSLEFAKFSSGPPLGMDVDVKLVGRRLTTLKQLAEEIKRELRVMPGLYDVQDDFDWGKERIRVEVDQEKAALAGLSVSDVARAVRDAFEGRLASTIREGDEEIKVVVKFDQKARQEVESIQDM